MTCRQRLALEHPEAFCSERYAGIHGCPDTYGYMRAPEWCPILSMNDEICTKCWDREIPEQEQEPKDEIYETEQTLEGEDMSIEEDIIWVVTYYDNDEYPVVTAFDNKSAALKCYRCFLGEHDKVDIDKIPIYSSFHEITIS